MSKEHHKITFIPAPEGERDMGAAVTGEGTSFGEAVLNVLQEMAMDFNNECIVPDTLAHFGELDDEESSVVNRTDMSQPENDFVICHHVEF